MAEIYEDKRWELKQGDKIYPHLTTEILQRWVVEGVVSDDDLVREEGAPHWEKLNELKEFKFLLWAREKEAKVLQNIEEGHSYIIKEKKPRRIFEILQNFVSLGYRALCVTRIYYEEIREKYKLGKTDIFWLSKEERENCLSPTDLGRLAHTIIEFFKHTKDSICALEGLEYLITHNDFEKVLRLVDDLSEKTALSKSRLILSVTPETLEEKQLALLERNLESIEVEEE
ncbi:MAG: DUF835 domain-containing protein [Candidatus Thermoplasmatota archaeon]|nr:DUF835 domain-containing protein [Candidatus Thermoplasmatota archaeon]